MKLLEVSGLTAGYGDREILRDITFYIEPGQMAGILGANGSGKTTLLKALCQLLPHGGGCAVEGVPLEGLSPRRLAALCGYIPQRSGITIDISALDVVLMGYNPRLGLLERPSKAMKEQAERLLEQVGLPGYGEKNYLHLSEGQKQLCILARTLAADSRFLLLDEPESALDLHHRTRMLAILRQWTGQKKGALLALHDPALALNCCDRLFLLEEGRLMEGICPRSDPPEEMEEKLGRLYGPVTLLRCRDKGGREHLVMLRDKE